MRKKACFMAPERPAVGWLAGAGWSHAACPTRALLPPTPAAVAAWTCQNRRWPRGRTLAGSRITVSACAWARRSHPTLQLLPRPRLLLLLLPLLAALRLPPPPGVPLLLGAVPRLQKEQLAEGQLLLPLLPALHLHPPAAAVHPPVALLPMRAQAGAPRLKAAAAAAARCAIAVVAAALRTAAM